MNVCAMISDSIFLTASLFFGHLTKWNFAMQWNVIQGEDPIKIFD